MFRTLRQPLMAVPLFVLILYGWHFSVPFEAAVRHPGIHALQHACFVAAGILVWWSALEPQRRRLRGELWKIPYIFAARVPAMMLGMGFIFVRQPLYEGVYGSGERPLGLDALADQQIAGALMMTTDILIIAFALCFFFYRASQDAEEPALTSR
jgi:cytochrome c oxidase assembly factor CtaG